VVRRRGKLPCFSHLIRWAFATGAAGGFGPGTRVPGLRPGFNLRLGWSRLVDGDDLSNGLDQGRSGPLTQRYRRFRALRALLTDPDLDEFVMVQRITCFLEQRFVQSTIGDRDDRFQAVGASTETALERWINSSHELTWKAIEQICGIWDRRLARHRPQAVA